MYTIGIVPSYVYTSRKSSSAAGLIATVDKEPEIGEFCNDKWFLAMKNLQVTRISD